MIHWHQKIHIERPARQSTADVSEHSADQSVNEFPVGRQIHQVVLTRTSALLNGLDLVLLSNQWDPIGGFGRIESRRLSITVESIECAIG